MRNPGAVALGHTLGVSALLALLVGVPACTSTMPVVYALSPNPTPAFPNGSLSSPVSEWVMVGRFPNIDACESALPKVQTKVQRPVQCIRSNDLVGRDPFCPGDGFVVVALLDEPAGQVEAHVVADQFGRFALGEPGEFRRRN